MKVYALYKGEQLIADGTIDEIASETNVKRETVLFYGTVAHAKRSKGNAKTLILLEEDSND